MMKWSIIFVHGKGGRLNHQARAIDAVLSGKNVVIVTPTASGKTICYNVPVLVPL